MQKIILLISLLFSINSYSQPFDNGQPIGAGGGSFLASTTYENWIKDTFDSRLSHVKDPVETLERHKEGVVNAFITNTTNGKHKNINGSIQSLLAKGRGLETF